MRVRKPEPWFFWLPEKIARVAALLTLVAVGAAVGGGLLAAVVMAVKFGVPEAAITMLGVVPALIIIAMLAVLLEFSCALILVAVDAARSLRAMRPE